MRVVYSNNNKLHHINYNGIMLILYSTHIHKMRVYYQSDLSIDYIFVVILLVLTT